MNWIERMYEIKGKDLYSQNGEGLLLEYILRSLYGTGGYQNRDGHMLDIGCGDSFVLSNGRHLHNLGYKVFGIDQHNRITVENCISNYQPTFHPNIINIDIDGFDYWILDKMIPFFKPEIVLAEFNPAFTDSRTIKYNPNHEWAGDDYYGFSFEAGKKLAEKHGYEIIFNVANMNLIMVRKDLINVPVPPVSYEQVKFFKESNRTDWVWI